MVSIHHRQARRGSRVPPAAASVSRRTGTGFATNSLPASVSGPGRGGLGNRLTQRSVALRSLDSHASQTNLAWVIDAYSLVFASVLLVGGALGTGSAGSGR